MVVHRYSRPYSEPPWIGGLPPSTTLTPERNSRGLSRVNGGTMAHTVLLVDDDEGVLDVLTSMLEDLGCHVIRATSGPEALVRLESNDQISILITDINMPRMDGHELAERATRMRPALKVLQLSGR